MYSLPCSSSHEAVPEKAESVQTVTLGPLVDPLSVQTWAYCPLPRCLELSLSALRLGPRGVTSPARIRYGCVQTSPLVRGVLERSQEGIDLVVWENSSCCTSTPKFANRKNSRSLPLRTLFITALKGTELCICLFICLFVYLPIYYSEQAQSRTTKLLKLKPDLLSFKNRSTVRRFTALSLSL